MQDATVTRTRRRALYACSKCGWRGWDAACTEEKEVRDDGSYTRRWYALCPKCFDYVPRAREEEKEPMT